MPISRALLLKGLGGVAAVGAVGVGGYGFAKPNDFSDLFKSNKTIEGEKKNKADEINKKLKELGLTEEVCKLDNSDFSNTTEYSKECELDKDKFQKIKFSNAGDNDVEVEGWNNNENKIKLSISNKSNGGIRFLFKDVKDDLTITKSSTEKNEKITIRSGKETEFKEENGKLVKLVDQDLKEKLEKVNQKLSPLSLPAGCSFDVTEKDKELECGLNESTLKAIKFSNKQDNQQLTVTGAVGEGLKLKVEVKDKEDDPSISFAGLSEDLTILGESTKGKIVIKKEGDRKFSVVGEKLKKVSLNKPSLSDKLEKINQKLSTLSLPNDCRFDVAEQDKVLECELDADKLKAIKFSNKGDTGTLTLSNDTIPGSLKIKVEAKDNEDEATFSFTGLSQDLIIYGDKTKGKIVLKQGSSKEFKVVDEKLEKVTKNDETKIKKLQEINKQLSDLKIPDKCLLDEREEDASSECELSLEDFKKIELTSKEGETLTVTEGTDLSKMKLKVEFKKNEDTVEDETFYTISDLDKKIKFGKTGEEIVLETNKSYEFEVRKNKFGPKRLLKHEEGNGGMAARVGLTTCNYTNNSNKGTCSTYFMNMIFMNGGTETEDSINWSNQQGTFNFWEYQEGFEKGIKFTFTGTNDVSATGNSNLKLETNKNYEIKEKNGAWKLKKKPNS